MYLSQIRKAAVNEEIDYLFLLDQLKQYAYPRDKISSLLHSGELIRIKKGLYIFGEQVALQPFCPETLANLIYGPSAISLQYALSFYGMIPERVATITSITNKKDKAFHTPVGDFIYRYIHPNKYSVGITHLLLETTHPILIASREKALADVLMLTANLHLKDERELHDYLFADLRLDEDKILSLNKRRLNKIAKIYQDANVNLLISWVESKA